MNNSIFNTILGLQSMYSDLMNNEPKLERAVECLCCHEVSFYFPDNTVRDDSCPNCGNNDKSKFDIIEENMVTFNI